MRIFTFAQKSPEWWAIRRGIPTASEFDQIIQPIKGGPSASQGPYMDQLIAELLDQQYSRQPENTYISPAMQNGIDGEPEARSWYAFERDVDVTEVGFCLSDCGRYGASPDGIVGTDGILEIKRPDLKAHVRYLREQRLPPEYKCQVHGELAVTGYAWLDFISYSPTTALDHFLIRVEPDEFTEKLRSELVAFCDRLDEVKRKLGIRMEWNDVGRNHPGSKHDWARTYGAGGHGGGVAQG